MNKGSAKVEAVDPDVAGKWIYAQDAFPKTCSCGAVYHESDWTALRAHGVFLGTDDTTGRQFGKDLEIRVCTCGSSIAINIRGVWK